MIKKIPKGVICFVVVVTATLLATEAKAQRTYYTQSEVDNIIEAADTVIYRYHHLQSPKFKEALIFENRPLVLDYEANQYPLRPLFAIKTNLLYDVVTALNVEVEVPLGVRYSVSGEWIFPWWLSDSRQRSFELLCGTVEGRYWFGERSYDNLLTGWAAGLYVGAGYYDLEWNGDGYQGEYVLSGGISATYAHSIGGNFRLEYTAGVGLLTTKYRKYKAQKCGNDWNLLRTRRGTNRWFGPTQLGVSLSYMLQRKDKRGGTR